MYRHVVYDDYIDTFTQREITMPDSIDYRSQESPTLISEEPPSLIFEITWMDNTEVPLLCGECQDEIVVDVDSDNTIIDVDCGCEEHPSVWCFTSDSAGKTTRTDCRRTRTMDNDSEGPEHECPDCDRTFGVEFTGPTSLHHAETRYCPRCGGRL